MGALRKARLALAGVAAAAAWAYWAETGVHPLPPTLEAVREILGGLPGLAAGMEPFKVLAVAAFLAAGVLSLLSPAGIMGAAVLAGLYTALRGSLDPQGLAVSAITGAFALAVAFDGGSLAAAAFAGVKRKSAKPRREQGREAAPARRLSYFPVGPLRIPRVIDGYEVVDFIGRGAFTVVYKVRKEGRVYAMKVPLDAGKFRESLREYEIVRTVKSYKPTPEAVASAASRCGVVLDQEEAAVLAAELERYKRNIIDVYAYNERAFRRLAEEGVVNVSDDPPYLIVEYAGRGDAKSMAEEIASRPSSLLEIAGALALFHMATGLVHRDVKLENILVASDGRLLLADFGIAMPEGEAPEGWHSGTPTYMPPEALFYPRFPALPSYDVYSLGVLYYRLVTGEYPIRQHYFIVVSRHPKIGEAARMESLRVTRMFELSALGTTGAITQKIRETVYPPHVKEGEAWQREALTRLSEFLTGTPAGAAVLSHEKETLAQGAGRLGLPADLIPVIARALDPDPERRHPTPFCLWLELKRVLAGVRG